MRKMRCPCDRSGDRRAQRDHVRAESLLYHPPGRGVGALAVSHPKLISLLVPQAIASPFKDEIVRQFSHCIDEPPRPKRVERRPEISLLRLSLGHRNRASNTVRARTTAAFAVKTRSGKPFTGGTSSTVAPDLTTALCNPAISAVRLRQGRLYCVPNLLGSSMGLWHT